MSDEIMSAGTEEAVPVGMEEAVSAATEETAPAQTSEGAPSESVAAPEENNDIKLFAREDGVKRRWYAIHAHSGQEGNVKRNLLRLAEQKNLADAIGGVLIPMEDVAEIKSGQKKISKRKFFPGYVLVQLPEHPERNPDLWDLVKETPGVTGFIGSGTMPWALEDAEVQGILEEIRGDRERPKPKVKFEAGERVKIVDGPFSNFVGNIGDIDLERGTLKVMVEIFERLTSVEVEFWQVEKQ